MPVVGNLSHSNKWTIGLNNKISRIFSGSSGTGIIIEDTKNNPVKKKVCASERKSFL